ncbi:hypothetical protein V8E36_004731 [Tilletia maclaganii]
MEDSVLFFSNSAASATFGLTPSELDQSASMSAFPFFTSPPTLSPYQTMERSGGNKGSTSFFASSAPKILAESFDAALQALSRQSAPSQGFSPADSVHKRPGLPIDFKKPASSIASSAPSSATSDASDVLADRTDSDFDPDLSADSISLGSNQGRFESWSISPSPVLNNNLALPDVNTGAGAVRSEAAQTAADIFAQFIADDSNADTMDTIRGLPMTTPQRPSLFRDFSAMTSASSVTTMSMGSSPATPLDGQPMQRPGFGFFMDLGSPRKSLSAPGARPQLLERTHSQMAAGAFANMSLGMPAPHVVVTDPATLFTNVAAQPMPSPAFVGYTVEPSMLSCNPAHIAPATTHLGQPPYDDRLALQQQQMHHSQQQQIHARTEAVPLLRLDGEQMGRMNHSSPLKRSADGRKAFDSSKPAKRVKSESVEPQLPRSASGMSSADAFATQPSPYVSGTPRMHGSPCMTDAAAAEERPTPVRAIPGFIAQPFPAPSSAYMKAAEMQPDWAAAAAAAAQKCADTTNSRASAASSARLSHAGGSSSSRGAVVGPAALAAAQPTPIPVKALIGQHSAATLAHGQPVITATVPLPAYSGIITKRSRGRRVPNDPLEMQNLGKGGKIWTCLVPECGKCFRRSEHLKRHIRSIHTEERPYMCPFPGCKKGFSRHDNLNQHARVHQMADSDLVGGGSGGGMVPCWSSGSSSSPSRKRKQPDGCEEEEAAAAAVAAAEQGEDDDELDEE